MREPNIEELAARTAITEVIHRYCRGMDRMDRDLTLSCWHPGGTDSHAPLFEGSAEGFIEWLWPVHAAMQVTRHVVSNVIIELDLAKDRAASEAYWQVNLRVPQADKVYDIIAGGRYLDRFERVAGVWAIRHRDSIGDINRVDEVTTTLVNFSKPLIVPNNPQAPPHHWARDRSDLSYSYIPAQRF